MYKFNPMMKLLVGTVAMGFMLVSQAALNISQVPLLTQSASASPNLLMILDDSGSMESQFLYQYGGTGDGYGMQGPGNGSGRDYATCTAPLSLNNTCVYHPPVIDLKTTTTTTTTPGTTTTTPFWINKGTWSSSTNYDKCDKVQYSSSTKYYCKEDECKSKNKPGSSDKWILTVPNKCTGKSEFKDMGIWESKTYKKCNWVTTSGGSTTDYYCTPTSGGCNATTTAPSSNLEPSGPWSKSEAACVTVDTTPGNTDTNTQVTGTGTFHELSPDVNRLTYDPRTRYRTRLTGNGSATATVATPSTTTNFFVFFYGAGGTVTPKDSQRWDGSVTYGNPVAYDSYFAPYTSADQATNPDSALAAGATTGLSYPQCVGPCTGQPAAVSRSSGNFPKFANRSDCAGNVCTLTEEQQNYATWKKYYSNRIDMAKTGIGYALQEVSGGLRLGWATISQLGSSATTLGSRGAGVSALSQPVKDNFYTWLYAIKPSSNTPLRESLIAAGKYFSRTDNKGPWAGTPDATSTTLASSISTTTTSPADNSPAHASCRRSYAMIVTDGYYNGTNPALSDTDYTAITQIKGKSPSGSNLTFDYDGRTKPYAQQSTMGTMADIAMKYWITDLRPDLTNNVPQAANNPSFWQNMGFYGVTLGIDGTLPQSQDTLDNITDGTMFWTTPAMNKPTAIDDMWHGTVNSRGDMLNANNADELSSGMQNMLAKINSVTSSQSGVAASTAALSLSTTTRKYTPTYYTGSWVGNVLSSTLNSTSGNDSCTQWRISGTWKLDPDDNKYHWFVGNKKDGTPDLAPCSGATTSVTFNGIASASTRAIYAWNGSSYGNFDASNSYAKSATTGVAAKIGATADANLIDFLRGDQSNEDAVAANGSIETLNLYRYRPHVLGDIVNSKPAFVKGVLNMQYDKLPTGAYGQGHYAAFVTAKAARSEGVLFAGANDGMLHGFAENDGREVFAFVPRAVMPAMHLLSSRSYQHQYYVDGDTTEVDACLSGGAGCTTWSNLLLGTAGAGGKTVFALDVTNPTGMSASSIKWEITPTDISNSSGVTATTAYANMGHNLANIQTGVTTGGQWVAIFGNGYNGGSGTNASLFVANLDTGALIKEITVPNSGGDNGLGGVTVVRNSSKQIVGAYAGDLQGRMWKFDLSNSNSTNWTVDFGGDPLFSAGSTKPIVAAPTVVDLSDSNVWKDGVDNAPKVGYMVSFGTGKLIEATDVATTSQQTLYGVWDEKLFGASSTATGAARVTASNLVARTISDTSQLVITDTSKRGWYANFANTGDRLIYSMLTSQFHNLTATVLSPAGVTADACSAGSQGTSSPYILDALWVTVASTPPTPEPAVCLSASCIDPLNPPQPCLGPGCKPPCGGTGWSCTAPSGGEPVLVSTDQKCPNGAPLTKLLYSRTQTCRATCGDGTTLTSETSTINQCPAYNPPNPSSGGVKRTWRQLFMR
jgi:type IV pilus assembly protein PilY1